MYGTAAYIDAKSVMDPFCARKLGGNIDDLHLSQPDTDEQGLEIVDAIVNSGIIDILVVDSVADLVPHAEIEGEMGDPHVGLQAHLKWLKTLTILGKEFLISPPF